MAKSGCPTLETEKRKLPELSWKLVKDHKDSWGMFLCYLNLPIYYYFSLFDQLSVSILIYG